MKRVVYSVLMVLMILSLAACGQSTAAGTTGTATWQEQYDLGVEYLSDENYKDAVSAFASAIGIDAEQAAAYIGRGDAYTKLDEYGKAADDFETAISIDPALEDSYRIRIEALRSGGEYEDEKGNRYNVYGKKTRMMAYDAGGKLMWYHEYVYDEHGRSKSVTVFDADGNQTDYFDGFAYDENGNRTIAYGYMDDDGSICVCNHYTFDDNGNMLHMDTYNMSGVLTGYFDYSYGSDGKSTGYSEYDRNGNLVTYTEFTYNEQGLRTKIVYYKADGSVRGRSEFKYDADGICTESDNYDAAGNLVNHNVNKSS